MLQWTPAFVQTHMDEYKWLVLNEIENTMLTTATIVTPCQVTEETDWPNIFCCQTETDNVQQSDSQGNWQSAL